MKHVYKGHSREPENVHFMRSCPLPVYADSNYMQYSLMGKMKLSFIDSDLLYAGLTVSQLLINVHIG